MLLPNDRRAGWFDNEKPFTSNGRGKPARRPNIIIILADDMGWADLGCYGSLNIRTPVLDRVAADGLKFTHGYSTAPTCSPTRIGLYTGRYPQRLPVGMEEPLRTRDEHHGIPHDHPTLPSMLRDSGYATAMFGKWHCGWMPWFSPVKAGFETFFGNLDGAIDYFSHIDTLGIDDLWEGETEIEEVGYYTHMISDRVSDFIRNADDEKPFYIQVNYTAPHWPWEGPGDAELSEQVTSIMRQDPFTGIFHYYGGTLEKYAEMIEVMDEGIGQIVNALAERGMTDDTIVVFMSDNGGERFSFMWPFVGEKGYLEEGGIRVPFIMRWPRAIDPGQVSDVPADTMDVTATVLDAAGVTPHKEYPLDGVSLLPWLVDGAHAPEHDLMWRTAEQGAIRRGDYKVLIDREAKPLWFHAFAKEGERVRLINVAEDARERKDLSESYPELVEEMLATWRSFDAEMLPYEEAKPVNKRSGKKKVSQAD